MGTPGGPPPAAPDDGDVRLDPDPVVRFAKRLRELRARAGSPSFRQLARLTHYSSSTLADATAGRRLPTEAVLRAFVVACGEEPEPWIDGLRQAAAELARPAVARSAGDATGARTRRPARLLGLVAGTVTGIIALLGAGAAIGVAASTGRSAPRSHPASVVAPFTAVPTAVPSAAAADGADPAARGCTKDARLVDKSPVMVGGVQVGALELKYSARCGSGWARAYLYPDRPTMMAEVTVHAADGRAMSISEPLVKQVSVYTDVIVPGAGGCLGARAVVLDAGHPLVTATIPCQAPGG